MLIKTIMSSHVYAYILATAAGEGRTEENGVDK